MSKINRVIRGVFSSLFERIGLSRDIPSVEYRGDIDGLRAIAVLLVIGYHFYPRKVHAGFIGVDVFFVISGFLITKIILKDFAQGTFRLTHFYSRRILRLFPALIVVLSCLALICWFTFTSAEYMALGKHLAGSALYVSNFLLWREAGYFDESALGKPLLHMWSLGIEEQYYLMWPVFLLLCRKHLSRTFFTVLLITAVSFSLNMYFLNAPKGFAFYMPFTRAWELLIGGSLSYWQWLVRHNHAEIQNARTFLAKPPPFGWSPQSSAVLLNNGAPYLGIALIALALFLLDDKTPYPGFAALLPAFGAALLIAGQPNTWLHQRVLSHPSLVWLGLISYPLYLWHWSLLSVTTVLGAEFPSRGIRFILLLTAFFLAWFTCKYIELPLRRRAGARTIVALLSGIVLIGAFGAFVYVGKGLPKRHGITAYEQQIEAYERKLDQFKFPFSKYPVNSCKKEFPGSGWCAYAKEGAPTIALIGDSHAHHFFPGLARIFAAHNENLALLGSPGCPPLLGISSRRGNGEEWCVNGNEVINRVAKDKNIQTVILAANWHLYVIGKRFTDSAKKTPYWNIGSADVDSTDKGESVFRRQLRITLRTLLESGKKTLLIKQIPELDFDPKICLRRPRGFVGSRDCRLKKKRVQAYLNAYETILDEILLEFRDVVVLDPSQYMCNATHCPVYIGDASLYRDRLHLSMFGSDYLAEKWRLFRE